MTETPHVWNIGESIPIEIFVPDPATTGDGLTGQLGYLTLTIQRDSDSWYWNGSGWQASVDTINETDGIAEPDAVNQPGRYVYLLPASANQQADRYIVRGNLNNPGIPLSGDNYEVHISRVTDLRVYDGAPSQ